MKDILNNFFTFANIILKGTITSFPDYKPEDLLKYLYIGNLIVLTFIFIIMGIEYDLLDFNTASGDYRGNNEFYIRRGTSGKLAYHLPWYSIPFYLTYAFILGLSYLCCIGKSNFWKILLGTFVHFNLLVCILFTTWNYDFLYSYDAHLGINAPGFLNPIYALPLLFYTLLIIVYFLFYFLFPYINKTYSNSLLGLYLETKKIKLKKLKSKLKDQIKEDD